jgi:6-phosphogluconolactonase
MGDDGHTASIFPHEIDLWTSDKTCVVATHPISGQKRISLSGGVINNARAVAFLVTGQNKAEKIEKILHKKPLAVNYPANLVAPVNGSLHWFLDGAAAQKL